jgi:dTDP-4-dehydrorhamnose 3,5-epimerase-like enzyme
MHSLISPSASISETATIGPSVIIGDNANILDNVLIDSGSIIASNVTIGEGAWLRAGTVALDDLYPYGIYEGNPSSLIGFRNKNCSKKKAPVYDRFSFELETQNNLELPVKGCLLTRLPTFIDPRGQLTVGELNSQLPFIPKRFFFVYNVPFQELRGDHAHIECHQFIVCIRGSVKVLLDDGCSSCQVFLDNPSIGLYMPPMTWGSQFNFTESATIVVFASHHYDSQDYIRSYADFISSTY